MSTSRDNLRKVYDEGRFMASVVVQSVSGVAVEEVAPGPGVGKRYVIDRITVHTFDNNSTSDQTSIFVGFDYSPIGVARDVVFGPFRQLPNTMDNFDFISGAVGGQNEPIVAYVGAAGTVAFSVQGRIVDAPE